MKRILIIFGLLFLLVYSFGKYQVYQRYNSDSVLYKRSRKVNLSHYNKEVLINYNKAVEDLNGFVSLQWFSNNIDVLKPEQDDEETKNAIAIYSEKLASLKFYESILEESNRLKKKGLSNTKIKAVIENKKTIQELAIEENKNVLRKLFENSKPLKLGGQGEIIFEIQKLLVAKGYEITTDGLGKQNTYEAIKDFQKKNNLFEDGLVDWLTFEKLLK